MSVEILFVRDDKPGSDEFTWKRGDPVVVQPAGWKWGREEDPVTSNKFFIVTVTGAAVTVETVKAVLDDFPAGPEGEPLRLRTRRLISTAIPAGVLTQLLTTGRYTTTWSSLRNFIRNMRTGTMGG